MNIFVHLQDTATKEVVVFPETLPDDGNIYLWEEGNYSCDCNRYLFLQRAKGEVEDEEVPCGNGRYAINLIGADGSVIYSEF